MSVWTTSTDNLEILNFGRYHHDIAWGHIMNGRRPPFKLVTEPVLQLFTAHIQSFCVLAYACR